MMNKLQWSLATILLVLIVVSISGCMEEQREQTKHYSNENYGFSFDYPGDWNLKENSGKAIVELTNGGIIFVYVYENVAQPSDFTKAIEHVDRSYSTRFEGYKKISDKIVTINEVKGFEIIFTSEEYGQYKHKAVFLFKNSKEYEIGCTAPQSEFYKYNDVFDAVIQSFKIK